LRRLQVVELNMMALTAMPVDYALDPDLDFALINKIPNAHRMDMEEICWMPTFDANKVVSWHCRLCDKIRGTADSRFPLLLDRHAIVY
jgi:hypothetical protein